MGVDTERFSAHSTRGASTSHAKMKGVPVTDILKVANWSSRNTFERFYHRPSDSSAFTRAVLQSSRNLRYTTCFKRTTSKHCTLYPEPPKYNLQIPEDKVRTGRMDCMRRWRIQCTVDSHPLFTVVLQVPSLLQGPARGGGGGGDGPISLAVSDT